MRGNVWYYRDVILMSLISANDSWILIHIAMVACTLCHLYWSHDITMSPQWFKLWPWHVEFFNVCHSISNLTGDIFERGLSHSSLSKQNSRLRAKLLRCEKIIEELWREKQTLASQVCEWWPSPLALFPGLHSQLLSLGRGVLGMRLPHPILLSVIPPSPIPPSHPLTLTHSYSSLLPSTSHPHPFHPPTLTGLWDGIETHRAWVSIPYRRWGIGINSQGSQYCNQWAWISQKANRNPDKGKGSGHERRCRLLPAIHPNGSTGGWGSMFLCTPLYTLSIIHWTVVLLLVLNLLFSRPLTQKLRLRTP